MIFQRKDNKNAVDFKEYLDTSSDKFLGWSKIYENHSSYEVIKFVKKDTCIHFSQDLREHRVSMGLFNNGSGPYISMDGVLTMLNEQCLPLTGNEYIIFEKRKKIPIIGSYNFTILREKMLKLSKLKLLPSITEEIDAYIDFLLENQVIP